MPDVISPAERALIDAALADGRVTRPGRGESAWGNMRNRDTGQVVWVNKAALARDGKVRIGMRGAWMRARDLEPISVPQKLSASASQSLTPRQCDILALHLKGGIPADIGAQVGLSDRQVRTELARMGHKANTTDYAARRAAAKQARRDQIAAMLRENPNLTGVALAAILGVSAPVVCIDLRDLRAAVVI